MSESDQIDTLAQIEPGRPQRPEPKSGPESIEAMLAAGVPIAEIASSKATEWRRGSHDVWLSAVEAVQAVREAEPPPAPTWIGGIIQRQPVPRPRSKLQPIEWLVLGRVPRSQGIGIVERFYGLTPMDANLAIVAFDAVARALDVTPPGSTQGLMAEAGESWIKSSLGMDQNTPLPMPVTNAPRQLDVLNAAISDERQGRQRAAAAVDEHLGHGPDNQATLMARAAELRREGHDDETIADELNLGGPQRLQYARVLANGWEAGATSVDVAPPEASW